MVRKQLTSVIRNSTLSDADRLYFLNLALGQHLVDLHDTVQCRVELLRNIRDYAEDGYVGIVFGGIDCDGVQYEGQKVKSPANEVLKEIELAYKNAEGPIHWYVCRVSSFSAIKSESYDLALSAFEEGHPHTLYPH